MNIVFLARVKKFLSYITRATEEYSINNINKTQQKHLISLFSRGREEWG
jgi:hypothetical protein